MATNSDSTLEMDLLLERDSLERELEMELERELEEMEREKMEHEEQTEKKLDADGETPQPDLKILPNNTAVLQQDAAQRVAGLPRPARCPCPPGDSICMTVAYESARIYCDHEARSIRHYCGKTPKKMRPLSSAAIRNGPPRKLIADDALVDTGCHNCEKQERHREQRT